MREHSSTGDGVLNHSLFRLKLKSSNPSKNITTTIFGVAAPVPPESLFELVFVQVLLNNVRLGYEAIARL